MEIAATLLLILLIPLTLLANVTLRESKRAHGPDIMGPAFMFVVSAALRWIVALVIIALLIAGGSLDGWVPNRGVQLLLVIAVFALVDSAAGITTIACAPENAIANPPLILLGRILSFAVPLLMIIWLVPMVHEHLPRLVTWTTLGAITVLSIGMIPVFRVVHRRTTEHALSEITAYYERRQQLTVDGLAQIAALPFDCPLEKLTAYLIDQWPPDVQAEATVRINQRHGIADELLIMLNDDQRQAAAFAYLQSRSGEPALGFNLKLRDLSLKLATSWKARGTEMTAEESAELAADCEGFIHIAYGRHTETLDFYSAMNAWKEAVQIPPQTPEIIEARKNLDHWFELYPRLVATSSSPAAER